MFHQHVFVILLWGILMNPLILCPSPGTSDGPIWMTRLGCRGYEDHLGACTHRGFGQTWGCTHQRTVGVVCSNTEKPESKNLSYLGVITSMTTYIIYPHAGVITTECANNLGF